RAGGVVAGVASAGTRLPVSALVAGAVAALVVARSEVIVGVELRAIDVAVKAFVGPGGRASARAEAPVGLQETRHGEPGDEQASEHPFRVPAREAAHVVEHVVDVGGGEIVAHLLQAVGRGAGVAGDAAVFPLLKPLRGSAGGLGGSGDPVAQPLLLLPDHVLGILGEPAARIAPLTPGLVQGL